MRGVLAYALGAALLVHVAAHVALAARIAQRAPRWRGLVALVVTPLAFWWGLAAGDRRLATAWLASVTVYAALVALA